MATKLFHSQSLPHSTPTCSITDRQEWMIGIVRQEGIEIYGLRQCPHQKCIWILVLSQEPCGSSKTNALMHTSATRNYWRKHLWFLWSKFTFGTSWNPGFTSHDNMQFTHTLWAYHDNTHASRTAFFLTSKKKKKKFHSCNALSLQDTKFQTGCNVFKQCILAPRS